MYEEITLGSVVLDISSAVGNLKVYRDRLTVSNPSVLLGSIRASVSVKSGKWYYEVELATQGLFQIGWVTSRCHFRPFEGYGFGVGDDEYSWAVDFQRGILHFIDIDFLFKCCPFFFNDTILSLLFFLFMSYISFNEF